MTDCVVTRNGQPHVQRGAHGGHCPGEACDGCLPVPALPGLLVCGEDVDHVRTALRELPQLWLALAEPATSHAGDPNRPDPTPRALPPLVATRSVIRSTLVTWCRVLEDEHDVPVPDERLLARWTRLEILRVEYDRDVALHAWRNHPGDRPGDRPGRTAHHQQAAQHAAAAAALRERRATDLDLVDGLREHIDRHLLTLLADHPADAPGGWEGADSGLREAQQFAEDVLDIHRRARSLAYPHRAAVHLTCSSCGGTVGLDAERPRADAAPRTFRCSGCGTTATLDDWRRMEAPDASEPLSLSRLAGWLATAHGYEVTLKQMRGWRDRGIIRPVDCCIPFGALGPHKPGCTQRFDPAAVLLVARHRLEGKRSA